MDDSMNFVPSGIIEKLNHQSTSFMFSTNQTNNSNSNSIDSNVYLSPCGVTKGGAAEFSDINHSSVVVSNLARYRANNFMCDVEIEVEGVVFAAHRCVLAAAIPYFYSMFNSAMMESRQCRISIQDISPVAFQSILDFAYTGKVVITGENLQQLLYSASILQMDTLCSACQRFLTQYLTTANCLSIRQFAEQHNCVNLLSSVDDFAMEHFLELRLLPEFLHIPVGHLMDLVKSSDLKVNSENEVFESVIHWIQKDVENRKEYLADLLLHVRLTQLPVLYFLNVAMKHPLIMDSVNCRDIVADALTAMVRSKLIPVSSREGMSKGTVRISSSGDDTPQSFSNLPMPTSIKSATKDVTHWTNCRPRKSAAGVVFCVGGRGTTGDPFRSVEAFDWRKARWFSISDMNVRRRHVGVVSAHGKLYAIGGHDGNNHLDSAECFYPETNMWHTISPMGTRRRGIAAGSLEGAIYAVGGLDDTACFHTVERYDIELDKWSIVSPMNVQRGGVGVAALGKHLFAVGGNDGTSSLDSCERYDPLLNKWKLVASMQHRRAGAGVTVLDGFLYAIGGFDDNAPLPSCERYNPDDDSWTLVSQMSCPRGGVGVSAMGGLIYAVGGHDGVRYLNSVEAYNPIEDLWFPVALIGQCRAGAGVSWADCTVNNLLRPLTHGKGSGCAPFIVGVDHCI